MPDRDIKQRIAEVCELHLPTTHRVQSRRRADVYSNEPACKGCPWTGKGSVQTAHRAHVAAEVVKALGLTEESGRVACPLPLTECTWSYGCGHDGKQLRYVTSWEPADA